MPTYRSSSSLNTRVFSPTVVLTQDTRRLFINLTATDPNYSIQGGIIAGDVIRYDPLTTTYKKSQADNEVNAEVIGIVESVNSGVYTVVTAGSIAYPTARLNSIIEGSSGGVDILFLDPNTAGGLTGAVVIPTGGTSAIVKPVVQVAPHSIYNGIVLNYIGYKIGNAVEAPQFAPVGNIVYANENSDPGLYYKKADGFELVISEYPDMYELYGLTNGPHTIQLTVNSAVGISSSLVGTNVTQFYNGTLTTIGTVTDYNSVNKTITLTRTQNAPEIYQGSTVYAKGYSWSLTAFTPLTFTVPAINNTIQQGNITLVPFISTKPTVSVNIPDTISVENLQVSGTASVGAITNLEQKIAEITADITSIKSILRIGGS